MLSAGRQVGNAVPIINADWPVSVRSLKQRTGLGGCVALNASYDCPMSNRQEERVGCAEIFHVERMERRSQQCRELADSETDFPFRRPEQLRYESTWRHAFLHRFLFRVPRIDPLKWRSVVLTTAPLNLPLIWVLNGTSRRERSP